MDALIFDLAKAEALRMCRMVAAADLPWGEMDEHLAFVEDPEVAEALSLIFLSLGNVALLGRQLAEPARGEACG